MRISVQRIFTYSFPCCDQFVFFILHIVFYSINWRNKFRFCRSNRNSYAFRVNFRTPFPRVAKMTSTSIACLQWGVKQLLENMAMSSPLFLQASPFTINSPFNRLYFLSETLIFLRQILPLIHSDDIFSGISLVFCCSNDHHECDTHRIFVVLKMYFASSAIFISFSTPSVPFPISEFFNVELMSFCNA